MKIKTQFINSMVIFGIILLIIAISVIATNQQVERLNMQEEITKNIEHDISELGYLSNDYLLYHESPQRARWEAKFSELSDKLSNLKPNNPEQQVLINDIRENQQRLEAIFTDVVATFENASQDTDPSLFQISWSRMAVQNQGMMFDASRLSQMLRDQEDQVKQTNITLIFVLLGIFAAYFLINYLIVYRSALKSISALQAGIKIIGSGNLDYFIETNKQDEIGELSRAFNQTTADLKGVTASRAELEKEIIERKRAEEGLRESNQHLDLLSYTAGRLLTSDRPQQIIEELCQRVLISLDCSVFFNYLMDEERQRLHLNAFSGIPEEAIREIEWLDYGVAVCGCAARDGSRIVCENIPDTPDPRTDLVRSFGIKAYACHPLFSHGNVIGTLSFGTRSRLFFNEDELTLMKTVTDQVAIAIERVKARDELELRVKERTIELEVTNKSLLAEIEERKRAEEKIREQAALLDKAQDAIAARDLEHRLIYWNKGAQRLYGWTAEETIGKNADELLYKEESSDLIEAKKSVIEKGEWIGELRQRTKDNKDIIVEGRWTLVHDNDGKPKSILFINTDITEKKRLEAQLLRAQRMESIGTLAGGIAHDINNMLTPIMLSLQMLKEKFGDEQSQKLLTILEQNSQRGAALIRQVLSFARGIEGERKPLEITHIISEIEKIITNTFPRNIEIQIDINKDLYNISGDATQLHQVIMNLCINARDAMPDGGTLHISAGNVSIDEDYVRMHNEAKAGSYIAISVSDTGAGIPSKILDRIFDPFFTTKEFGKGTGLGLPTALAIVKSHGGFINVDSKVGKGTTFGVYLPATLDKIRNVEEQQLELPAGHGELVLVAEDEDSVREVTISILEKYGYNVLAANDGAEAVALYTQNKDKTKVVLMDMMMPVMDGYMAIRAIRKITPEVRVIIVSGLAEKDKLKNMVDCTNAFLPKPYTAERLLRTIHEVISAK
ncbi:MAG: response regulator [Candidatus Methanoperedens sp.]|nr:response regulator [Candidatus Methanoperedens sp.]